MDSLYKVNYTMMTTPNIDFGALCLEVYFNGALKSSRLSKPPRFITE